MFFKHFVNVQIAIMNMMLMLACTKLFFGKQFWLAASIWGIASILTGIYAIMVDGSSKVNEYK